MKKWEYQITNVYEIKWLNDMGLAGWEVCAIKKDTPTSVTEIILKREILNED